MKKLIAIVLTLTSLSTFACDNVVRGDSVLINWDSGARSTAVVLGFDYNSAILSLDGVSTNSNQMNFVPLKKVYTLTGDSVIRVGDKAMIVWDTGMQEMITVSLITASREIGYVKVSQDSDIRKVDCRKVIRLLGSIEKF